jgi:sigma-B regulation protein RsbU (phosphoserine phosphatase)
VLGVIPAAEYQQADVSFGPGDRLILFTDGLTEARSARPGDDDEFGEARLIDAAVRHRACSAPALQARLADEVMTFTGGHLHDDATLIVLAADAA